MMLIWLSNFLYYASWQIAKNAALPHFWRRHVISRGRNGIIEVMQDGDPTPRLSLQHRFHFYFAAAARCSSSQ
jgi:hypothetical protein